MVSYASPNRMDPVTNTRVPSGLTATPDASSSWPAGVLNVLLHSLSPAQASPGDKVSFSAFYRLDREDYDESPLGLSSAHYSAVGADVDYTPSARWTLFGYY